MKRIFIIAAIVLTLMLGQLAALTAMILIGV